MSKAKAKKPVVEQPKVKKSGAPKVSHDSDKSLKSVAMKYFAARLDRQKTVTSLNKKSVNW